MGRFKKYLKRVVAAVCVASTLTLGASLLVVSEARGQTNWLNAAQLETLRSILSTFGVITWPKFGSDPFTCNSNTEGAYYFNTSTTAFRVCDGTTWADGGGGVGALNDLSDVAITGAANNEILRFNSGSGDWENSAQSASAINDLSDVEAPSPSDGDILIYDGVTDNRWETVAGAAPTTLAGLSDTDITTPAESERLVYNGTDWENRDVRGSFVIFPTNYLFGNHSTSTNAVIALDNDVRVFRHHFPYACEVDSIQWNVDVQTGSGCDNGAVGLYSLDGNTQIIDSGAQAYTTNDAIINADITDTFVEEGSYWVAYTADETTSCTIRVFTDPTPTTAPGVDAILNTGSTVIGTAANQSVSGVLPATLGVITSNNNIDRPLIKFTCVDP